MRSKRGIFPYSKHKWCTRKLLSICIIKVLYLNIFSLDIGPDGYNDNSCHYYSFEREEFSNEGIKPISFKRKNYSLLRHTLLMVLLITCLSTNEYILLKLCALQYVAISCIDIPVLIFNHDINLFSSRLLPRFIS